MNQIKRIAAAALFLTLVMAPALMAATRAEQLFQQGLVKESAERDPEAALKLYQEAIDSAGKDKRLVAKANLHKAACLELLGKPKDAEALYLAVINDPAVLPTQDVQSAQANLERLQAQEKKAREEAARARPMVLVKEFHDTRFSVIAGPAIFRSGSKTGADITLAGRYRLIKLERPLGLYAELGGFFPISGTSLESTAATWNTTTTDTANLKLSSQIHLALIAELPHKSPKVIPEVGIGAAQTSSKISYASTGSTGESKETNWSPYITGGVRLRADKQVSVLLNVSYTANPYSKNIDIALPAHKQTFDFANSIWNLGAQVQIKIGSTKSSMRPKE